MEMRITKADLEAAVTEGVLAEAQLPMLIAFLQARLPESSLPPLGDAAIILARPRFDLSHVLWYAGALVVIGAMGLFSTLAFSLLGGAVLTVTALVYACGFIMAGYFLWHKKQMRVPGGLLVSVAVSMAPLAVYGIQSQTNLWGAGGDPGAYQDFFNWSGSSWIYMELATLIAAGVALRFFPFPFIVAIAGVAAWFLSMDAGAWASGNDNFVNNSWADNQSISLGFGIAMLVLAWVMDRRSYKNGDFAFWLHLFGLMIFWGAVSAFDSDSALAKSLYCLLNIGLIGLSLFLMRPVYAVFGALGVTAYLGDLSYNVFEGSLYFPFALSLIGVGIIALGLVYHRQRTVCAAWLAAHLPLPIQKLRPLHARRIAVVGPGK